MSKPITAAALMILVDAGRVDLDLPASEYIPELARNQTADEGSGLAAKAGFTLRQALSHTSGLPFASTAELQHEGGLDRFRGSGFAHFRSTGDDSVYDGLPLKDAVASYANEPLLSEPGSRFLYSNAGFNVIGRVIEVVSGQSYAQFVDTNLLQPLGMIDTTLWPTAAQLGRLAKSYSSSSNACEADSSGGEASFGSRLREVPFPQLTAPFSDTARRGASPSGGYFSTAADIARFGRMILCGGELVGRRYLSAASLSEMTTKQTAGASPAAGYGLGWQIDQADQLDYVAPLTPTGVAASGFGHGGAMGTELWLCPAPGRCEGREETGGRGGVLTVLMVHMDGGVDSDGGALRREVKAIGLSLLPPLSAAATDQTSRSGVGSNSKRRDQAERL